MALGIILLSTNWDEELSRIVLLCISNSQSHKTLRIIIDLFLTSQTLVGSEKVFIVMASVEKGAHLFLCFSCSCLFSSHNKMEMGEKCW